MEGKNPMEIKELHVVVKWQRARVTLFCNATTLKANPLQLVATVFTGKITVKPANDMDIEKRKHINTITYFSALVVVYISMMIPLKMKALIQLIGLKKFTHVP